MMMSKNSSCLIYGAKQIVQVVINKQKYVRGTDNMKNVYVLEENELKGNLNLVSIEYLPLFYIYSHCLCLTLEFQY